MMVINIIHLINGFLPRFFDLENLVKILLLALYIYVRIQLCTLTYQLTGILAFVLKCHVVNTFLRNVVIYELFYISDYLRVGKTLFRAF